MIFKTTEEPINQNGHQLYITGIVFFGVKQLNVSPSYRNLGETQSLGQSGSSGDSL